MWSRAQYKGVTVIIDHLDLPFNAKEQFLFVDDENMVPLLIQADRSFKRRKSSLSTMPCTIKCPFEIPMQIIILPLLLDLVHHNQ